jgi:hypothetical protein
MRTSEPCPMRNESEQWVDCNGNESERSVSAPPRPGLPSNDLHGNPMLTWRDDYMTRCVVSNVRIAGYMLAFISDRSRHSDPSLSLVDHQQSVLSINEV